MDTSFSGELNEFSVGSTDGQILPLDLLGAFKQASACTPQFVCVRMCLFVSTCEGIKVPVWSKTD